MVERFLRFHLWTDTNAAHLRAYYEGYRVALETAPSGDLTCPARERRMADMRDCVERCAKYYGNL